MSDLPASFKSVGRESIAEQWVEWMRTVCRCCSTGMWENPWNNFTHVQQLLLAFFFFSWKANYTKKTKQKKTNMTDYKNIWDNLVSCLKTNRDIVEMLKAISISNTKLVFRPWLREAPSSAELFSRLAILKKTLWDKLYSSGSSSAVRPTSAMVLCRRSGLLKLLLVL